MFGDQLYQSNCVLVICCEHERHKREEHIRDNHEEERWGKECGVKLDRKMDEKYEQKIVSDDITVNLVAGVMSFPVPVGFDVSLARSEDAVH